MTTDEIGIYGAPSFLMEAYALEDHASLLRFWSHSIAPIPDDEFDSSHPLFASAVYVENALIILGYAMMTPEQALATFQRELYNTALPLARA